MLFNHNTGKALNASKTEGVSLTYITTSNVYWNSFELDNLKIMPFTESEIEKCTAKKGDLLVCEGGDIGRAAIWQFENEIRIQNHLHRLRPYDRIHTKFYYYIMYLYKANGRINGNGIGLQGLSSNALHNIIVPVPPVEEQKRIVDSIDSVLSLIEQIESHKQSLSSQIDNIKSKILDLAIRGKLVPQDPNDEPASVLLERIRAEKEELIKQGKVKRDKKESVIFKGDDNSYYEKMGQKTICIDEEIPFEIPDSWRFVRLKCIWELLSGRDLIPSKYNNDENGIPYITGASNFSDGKVNPIRWTPTPQVITDFGDILITCKGTVGEMAINDFRKAHIARQVMAIRNIYNLNTKYLSLCIQFYIESIKLSAKGLIPGISREEILNIILPIPPVVYQQRVVNSVCKYNNILNDIEASLN
ncbi:MAG: restriction endonuclease subunit S [Ruminococcus sp.]